MHARPPIHLAQLPTRGPQWGPQGGLLSEAEIQALYQACLGARRILEVGHYYGLSTAVLAATGASVVTLDGYHTTGGLRAPEVEVFLENHRCYFPAVMVVDVRSERVLSLAGFDTVFYDGDHHDVEQWRWTQLVQATPDITRLVLDDRDMLWPGRCVAWLVEHGWRDVSPPPCRTWREKTTHPDTMTLAVLRR
jgi:hypothetical protein